MQRALAAFLLAAIVAIHGAVVWRTLPRSLDHDEGEHLRAAAWVASGRTLYRDFVENHTPFLYEVLAPLAPRDSSTAALRAYVTSARVLTTLVGTVAALCVAAFAATLARDPLAMPAALAPLLALSWTSYRAVFDVRSEPYTLLLFWGGALLLLVSVDRGTKAAAGAAALQSGFAAEHAALGNGIGIGLIAAAAVWNPKWPAESLVFSVLFAWNTFAIAKRSWRDAAVSIAAALAIPALTVLIALHLTNLRDLVFFGYTYPAAFYRWFRATGFSHLAKDVQPFAFCSPWLWPRFVIPAAITLLALRRTRESGIAIALLIASGIEIRFLYSYPRLWPQYYAMWACCAAVVYGFLASELARFRLREVVAVVVVIAFGIYGFPRARATVNEQHWTLKEIVRSAVQPGEAVWVLPQEYPAALSAGSYYWYGFVDQVPFSLAYARQPSARDFLPPFRDEDFPPCRMLRARLEGPPPDYVHVRIIDQRNVKNLPRSAQCLTELWRLGAMRRIGRTWLWEVAPPARR